MRAPSTPQVRAVGSAGGSAKAGAGPLPCTSTKLRDLSRLVTQHYDAELSKVGLTTTQYWLLTEVLAHGPVRPCDLAGTMSLAPSTLTRNLRTLISAGWLDLGPGLDARTRSVRLTVSGGRKCAEALPHWITAQARVHQLIGSRNAGALHSLAGDCLASMSATTG
jgi:DNA-binding MarR family transcriptional regulator